MKKQLIGEAVKQAKIFLNIFLFLDIDSQINFFLFTKLDFFIETF